MRIEAGFGRWEVRTEGNWADGRMPRALLTHYDMCERTALNEMVMPFEEQAIDRLVEALGRAKAELAELRVEWMAECAAKREKADG